MDKKRATEILGNLRPDDPVMTALKVFINESAAKTKAGIYSTDWSGRESALGRALGYMEALEYIATLPKVCASRAAKAKAKQ